MKHLLLPLLIAILLVTTGLPGRAQSSPTAAAGDLRAMIESLRSDVNGFKVRLLNDVMSLTGAEAETFWPIYRQYEKELAAVGDQRVALIRDFASLHRSGRLEQAEWDGLSKRWLSNVQARVDLWKKYQKKIAKAVSPMRGAQFLQVENQIALFIDLNIASEMPVIGAPSR